MGLERTVFRMVHKVSLKLVVDLDAAMQNVSCHSTTPGPANKPKKTADEKKVSLHNIENQTLWLSAKEI